MSILDGNQLQAAIAGLDGWYQEGTTICKTWEVKPYLKAVAFVNQIAWLAEMQNHHPDIELTWDKVKVSITSHDNGALTARDIKLAHAIENLEKDF